jgi:hypothetical protein
MTERMAAGVPQADGSIRPDPCMDLRHAADAVLQMANLPLSANVLFMTVMATKMPCVGRGQLRGPPQTVVLDLAQNRAGSMP